MTALCGGGTSTIRLGSATQNVIGAGLITAGIEALAPWLLPAAVLIDAFIFEATSQCGSDPPPMPTWDASDAEILALGLLAPTAQQTITKINNLLLNWAWPQFCQCSSGVVPPAPTPTTAPPGVGAPSGASSQPCFKGHYQGTPGFASIGTPVSPADDFTTALLPTTGSAITVSSPIGLTSAHGAPAGVTTIAVTASGCHLQGDSSGTFYWPMDVFYYNSSGTMLSSQGFPPVVSSTSPQSFSAPVPANTAYWNAVMDIRQNTIGPPTNQALYDTQVYCGGASPTSLQNCCPPDPAISLGIQTLINLVQNLQTAVNAPKGPWVDGVTHVGLTNNGSFALTASNAIGIRVVVTTPPLNAEILPGTPNFYWNMGFLTPIALTSPLRGWRLVYLSESFSLPQFTDSIGYTLLGGTVVNITELLPAT